MASEKCTSISYHLLLNLHRSEVHRRLSLHRRTYISSSAFHAPSPRGAALHATLRTQTLPSSQWWSAFDDIFGLPNVVLHPCICQVLLQKLIAKQIIHYKRTLGKSIKPVISIVGSHGAGRGSDPIVLLSFSKLYTWKPMPKAHGHASRSSS